MQQRRSSAECPRHSPAPASRFGSRSRRAQNARCLARASGAPGALRVVRRSGRHVAHVNGVERGDVDAEFHGGEQNKAGRKTWGSPASRSSVVTYCAAQSPHEYYFGQPGEMVSGIVRPPALDLANRDLVEAHLHAVWLAQSPCALTHRAPARLSQLPGATIFGDQIVYWLFMVE
jgi:hypothetical protein